MQNKKPEHISILFSINQQKKLTRKYLSRMHWLVKAIETEIEQINLRELSICYGESSVWEVNNKHLWARQYLSLEAASRSPPARSVSTLFGHQVEWKDLSIPT